MPSLQYISYPDATTINSIIDSSSSKLNTIVSLPSAVTITSIVTGYKKCDIGEDVTTLKFGGSNTDGVLIVRSTHPENITFTGFTNQPKSTFKMYVPDASVSDYKSYITSAGAASGYTNKVYSLT